MTGISDHGESGGLLLRSVSKTFPGQRALDGVDLDVAPGEIHGLVGQNGSGKSTLIKILAGYHSPDDGARAWMAGHEFTLGSVADAARVGMRFVHQDLALVLELDAVDNVALGSGYVADNPFGRISWADQRVTTERMLQRFGVDIDVSRPVAEATQVERTAIAIVRAIASVQDAHGVLVLDEPTASLPEPEVRRLHSMLRDLARQGTAVIYVSHRLEEVIELAHRVSVLREGRCVAAGLDASTVSRRVLAELMTGEKRDHEQRQRTGGNLGQTVLRARGVTGRWLRGVDLEVRSGEAVGIAGVLGSGRDEFPYVLAGANEWPSDGEITVGGTPVPAHDPQAAKALGVALVPADRSVESVVGEFTVRENLTLPGLPALGNRGYVRRALEDRHVRQWMSHVQVVPAEPEMRLPLLSGGNQQKVVLARWMALEPRVLILAEPTAGVDIGAREALYDLIDRELKNRACAVVVASSDPEDLVSLCSRVVVLQKGRVAAELRGTEINPTSIIHAMGSLT